MAPPHRTLLALVALLAACATPSDSAKTREGVFGRPANPDDPASDGSGSDGSGSETPGGADDTGSGSEPGGSDGSAGDDTGGAPAGEPVRFVALGDAGTGSDDQYAVADAVAAVCERNGCDFALYLGDNFYNDGVTSVDDSQWQETFEQPYAALDFKFYAVLGNHDYGSGGGGFEIDRALAQVEYSSHSDKWVMPDTFYTHTKGDVGFFGLDTTALDWAKTEEQAAWLPGALASTNTKWKIAYGHHPYISNGDHGNANENFGPFFEDQLCGQVDVYLCGHDHDLQWLEPTCGTEFVVSGAAAKLRDLAGNENPSFFQQSHLGFLWVEIDGNTFTGVIYDDQGNELYRRSIQK